MLVLQELVTKHTVLQELLTKHRCQATTASIVKAPTTQNKLTDEQSGHWYMFTCLSITLIGGITVGSTINGGTIVSCTVVG